MSAPNISFSVTKDRLSSVSGFDCLTVTFQADAPYATFECRATKMGEAYGIGKGVLVASFSQTPAETARQFEVYDDFLTSGDGGYRISLFAQGEDGSWNDNHSFIAAGETMLDANGLAFLCMR